ncbi:alpha/beta hydrolase [Pseudoduganella sp. R-31]|uniref:alpha/beta hydrolase n=1 Tax=Pseudoduganella sp. R-31 TaxID=3404060 RepID=UPI003CF8EB39
MENELDRLEAMFRARPADLTIAQRREACDALAGLYPTAADVSVAPVMANGVPAEWTFTSDAREDGVILYLHGGGFVWGSLESHRHFVSELGRAAEMKTFALDYRRAPEFPFPDALDDAVNGYQYLLDRGMQLTVAGDSAGAGLAIAMLVRLRELGLPQPASTVLFSPWADMTIAAGSYARNAERDPVLNRELMLFLAEQYLGDRPRNMPLASPVFADLRGIAPLNIFVGATEALLDDSIALARAATIADVRVRLEIWPKMFHFWPNYYQELMEGKQALDMAGSILRDAMLVK